MHRIVFLCALICPAILACRAANASGEVSASPNPALVGETVTFRWFFTGDKVVVSGGRFGAGTVVTGRTILTDHPANSTRYRFDVWYKPTTTSPPPPIAPAPAAPGIPKEQAQSSSTQPRSPETAGTPAPADASTLASAAPSRPVSADHASASGALEHAQYTVDVTVVNPKAMGLELYSNSRGWRVHVLRGWNRDNVPLPDPANNALMYFQVEEDSVDRLAVAVVPAKNTSSLDMMRKIQADMPDHYDDVKVVSQNNIVYEDVPAVLAVCTGVDHAHPGVRTETILLVLVRDDHAYIVSGRTAVSRFPARQALLSDMVRSFRFGSGAPQTRSASPPSRPVGAATNRTGR